ncbi:MAG TPA: SRPBCC domain-containing protein [Steroidobacteraceae bacterium]|nr:SRPBCC domain-containing protein [Steroidobacteraceae bacterium]
MDIDLFGKQSLETSNATWNATHEVDSMTETLTEEIAIDVPPERVFEAWTEASHLMAWWGDGTEFRTTSWEGDLRVGGKWRAQFVDVKGNVLSVGGEYLRIDRPTCLSFTWKTDWDNAAPTTIELEFRRTDTGTLLILKQHGLENADAFEQSKQAWLPMVGWLKQYLSRPL